MIWENVCLFLVTCCMTVQSAIFYITKIVDSATFVYTVYHVIYDIRLIILRNIPDSNTTLGRRWSSGVRVVGPTSESNVGPS